MESGPSQFIPPIDVQIGVNHHFNKLRVCKSVLNTVMQGGSHLSAESNGVDTFVFENFSREQFPIEFYCFSQDTVPNSVRQTQQLNIFLDEPYY